MTPPPSPLPRRVHSHQASASGEVDKERAARAMADPEIQAILRDPIVQQTLKDCQADPSRLQKVRPPPRVPWRGVAHHDDARPCCDCCCFLAGGVAHHDRAVPAAAGGGGG